MIRIALKLFLLYIVVDFVVDINNSINPFLLEYQAFIIKYLSDKYWLILLFSIFFIFLSRYLTKLPPSFFKNIIFLILKSIYTLSTILFFSWFFYTVIKLENIEHIFNTIDNFYNKIKINNDSIVLNNFTQFLSNNFHVYNDLPGAFKNFISFVSEIIILLIMAITFIIHFVIKIIYKYFFFIFITVCTRIFNFKITILYYHVLNKINKIKAKT